ncbi:squalene monooxygenase protein [Rutstroemia sp. NJR-2017a WRK4]|nr:squalene monooxygenase protein [Rutstroemia sp. NJR-2017a WRK4]
MSPQYTVQRANEERRRVHHEADVVVVGAGVFGCAIAFALAKQGRSVLLLERWLKEPDRIVGELLQPGGVSALEKLGLSQCLEDIDSIVVKGYEVHYHGKPVTIPYPKIAGAAAEGGITDSKNEKSSRPEGRSFHHGRFISQLRKACASQPNITIVETEVTDTITGGAHDPQVLGVHSRTTNPRTGEKEADCYFGQLTIIADGYASKFRKQYIGKAPVVKSKFYALELIDCPMPAPNHGIVVLSDASPVLLYQIGTHETRALIDIPNNIPAASPAAGGVVAYIKNVVLPILPPQALYSLFAANDPQLKALQKGCFYYFQKGGNCIDGPVGLLAGIIRQPFVLFYHFFAVALLSIWIVMQETVGSLLEIWKIPLALEKSVGIFWKACVVIFPFIFSEIRS